MNVRTGIAAGSAWDERRAVRWGGAAAMLGAVLALIGNVLHPRASDVENVRAEIEMVADSDIWLFGHWLIAWALAFLFVGLLAMASYLDAGAGSTWARIGRASVVGGSVIAFIAVSVDGMAMKGAADNWAADGGDVSLATAEAVAQVSLALFTALIATFTGLTPVLLGIAQLGSRRFPAWVAYLAIGGGALSLVVASIQFLAGPSALVTNVLFTIGSLIVTVWAFLSGWQLWKVGPGTPAPAAEARVAA